MRYSVVFSQPPAPSYPVSRQALADGEGAASPAVEMTQQEWDTYVATHEAEAEAYRAYIAAQQPPPLPPAEALRLKLVEDLAALPIGIQLALEVPAAKVKEALQAGDIATARAIVETWPVFGDATLLNVRAAMLEKFP